LHVPVTASTIIDTPAHLRAFIKGGYFIGKLLKHTLEFIYNLLPANRPELAGVMNMVLLLIYRMWTSLDL